MPEFANYYAWVTPGVLIQKARDIAASMIAAEDRTPSIESDSWNENVNTLEEELFNSPKRWGSYYWGGLVEYYAREPG